LSAAAIAQVEIVAAGIGHVAGAGCALLNLTQPLRELTFAERYCPYLAPRTKLRSPYPPTVPETDVEVLPLANRIRVWAKRSELETTKISIKINAFTFIFFILFLL